MVVGVVNCIAKIDSIIRTFCLYERFFFGAGQRGLDNQGWTVVLAPLVRQLSHLLPPPMKILNEILTSLEHNADQLNNNYFS